MTFRSVQDVLKDAEARGLRRVLVVTALPLEMRAVRAHLTDLGSCVGRGSGSVYECGQFSSRGSEWLVVVAQSGAGNHPAQSVVTYAHVDFESFELVIFAGVAASRKPETPIGSVVASNRLHLPYIGKYANGEFTSRPQTYPVDTRLTNLASKVQRDDDWQARIKAPLKGDLPGADLYPKPFPPNAFVAPVVSVEAVSADEDSELERMISKFYSDSLALEMEGYGAIFAATQERSPCIVVRGISDLRGGKSPGLDEIHQPVAAAHAAAFGFELLDMWGQVYLPQPRIALRPQHSTPAVGTALVVEPSGGSAESEPQREPGSIPGGEPSRESTGVKGPTPPKVDAPVPTQEKGSGAEHEIPRKRVVLNFAGTRDAFPPEKLEEIVDAVRRITGDSTVELAGTEDGSFRIIIWTVVSIDRLDTEALRAELEGISGVTLLGVIDENQLRAADMSLQQLASASAPLLNWPRELPGGGWIERAELAQLREIIGTSETSTTALVGLPGAGKSALLSAFVADTLEQRIPVLAIKADFLDASVVTEDDLRQDLGLSELPSTLIECVSAYRPIVLVVDQLDALATHLDVKTGRLSVLLNLIRRIGGRRNVHVVTSCRAFEFEHDVRLKTVRANSLDLELPAWSAVLQILESNGHKPEAWPSDAKEVLRSPQALSTFLALDARSSLEPFRTYQAMLDQLWKERVLNRQNGASLATFVTDVAEKMADKETLWLAGARFEDREAELDALIASGILTRYSGNNSIGFSHQTLYEHALARAFARGKGRLAEYVIERMSSLFVRPKLWAALTYLRAVEPSSYEEELHAIWSASNLRFHLRKLLIDFLGQQPAPLDSEVVLMEGALKSPDRVMALQAITGSKGWFERFWSSLIAASMTDKATSGTAAVLLTQAWRFDSEKVAKLIRDRWLVESSYDGLTWNVLQDCPIWTGDLLDMAATVLKRSDVSTSVVDYTVAALGVEQPDIAIELVLSSLERSLESAIEESRKRAELDESDRDPVSDVEWVIDRDPAQPLKHLIEDRNSWESLESLARAAPRRFLERLWPWLKKVMSALRTYIEDSSVRPGFQLHYVGDFRFSDENALGLEEPSLLGAFRVAAEQYASVDPAGFETWLAENEAEDATPVQRLFAHALASQPERFSSRAHAFLLADHNRFHIGSFGGFGTTARRLVESVSPYWSEPQLRLFESTVLGYRPTPRSQLPREGRRAFIQYIRRIRLGLLVALPADRLSAESKRLITEEARRFPNHASDGVSFESGHIGSSMSADAMSKASDDEIVNAFREIPDASGWNHPSRWMSGGSIQLSREFATFAKSVPDRAAVIIKRFEPGYGQRAAGMAVDALAEASDPETVHDLISWLHEHGFDGEEFRGSIASAIGRLVGRSEAVLESELEMLEGWLSQPPPIVLDNDAGPNTASTSDEAESQKTDEGSAPNTVPEGSVLWGDTGFSILPSGNFPIIEAITRVLLTRDEFDRLLEVLSKHVERPEDVRVWNSMLRYLVYLKPASSAQKDTFFLRLFQRFPGLTASREMVHLLAHLHWSSPSVVRDVLLGWRDSNDPAVLQGYGELVGLISIVQPDLRWPSDLLAEIIEADPPSWKQVGAAYAAAHIWGYANRRSRCSELLIRLLPKNDDATWRAAFDIFRVQDEITPDREWIDLLQVISDHVSDVKGVSSSYIVERLQTLLPHEAPLVARLVRALVRLWRDELGDIRTGTSGVAPDIVDLAITLHRLGPMTRDAGTELFEDMLSIDAYSARQTLDQIDNRFSDSRGGVRRRLPRRLRGRSRAPKGRSG